MMLLILFRNSCLVFLLASASLANALAFYNDVKLEGYSEAFPLYDVIQGLDNDKEKGRYAFLMGKVEAGIKHDHFYYGILIRHETFLQASNGTNDIVYLNETDRPVPDNGRYVVDLDVNQMQAWGIAAGINFPLADTVNAKAGIQLLNAVKMLDGTLQGGIETFDADYQGRLQLDYFYTKDSVFDRQVGNKSALGISTNISVLWDIDEKNGLLVELDDVLNGIFWKDMYHTSASLTSNRISYDEHGNIDVRAALKGYEGNKDYTQVMPVKFYAGWHFQPNSEHGFNTQLTIIDQYQDIQFRYEPAVLRGVFFLASTHSVLGVGYQSERFNALLASDEMDYQQAHALMIQFSFFHKL